MRLLLDTHALLWWLDDNPALGPHARGLIADPSSDILVSVVSLWELVIKVRIGKLKADINGVIAEIDSQGFVMLGIRAPHLAALAVLPKHHRDPFDHMLMAQALAEGATFVSEDRNVALYPIPSLACSATISAF
jgi:PIN domain nuclease of toxin-antitoxin system